MRKEGVFEFNNREEEVKEGVEKRYEIVNGVKIDEAIPEKLRDGLKEAMLRDLSKLPKDELSRFDHFLIGSSSDGVPKPFVPYEILSGHSDPLEINKRKEKRAKEQGFVYPEVRYTPEGEPLSKIEATENGKEKIFSIYQKLFPEFKTPRLDWDKVRQIKEIAFHTRDDKLKEALEGLLNSPDYQRLDSWLTKGVQFIFKRNLSLDEKTGEVFVPQVKEILIPEVIWKDSDNIKLEKWLQWQAVLMVDKKGGARECQVEDINIQEVIITKEDASQVPVEQVALEKELEKPRRVWIIDEPKILEEFSYQKNKYRYYSAEEIKSEDCGLLLTVFDKDDFRYDWISEHEIKKSLGF